MTTGKTPTGPIGLPHRKKCPWPDINGKDVYDGDVIKLLTGARGVVIYRLEAPDPYRWTVDFGIGSLVPFEPLYSSGVVIKVPEQ